MPSPRNVQQQRDNQRRGSGQSGTSSAAADGSTSYGGSRKRRKGIALDINGDAGSYLSPTRILSSFSNMGITKYRDYLPTTDSAAPSGSKRADGGTANWQRCDLGDGLGRRPLLVITSPGHALQIFALPPSTIPDEPHVHEVNQAPEEVLSIGRLRDDSGCECLSAGQLDGERTVMSARLVDRGVLYAKHGSVALLLTSRRTGKGRMAAWAVEVLKLQGGTIVKKIDIGQAQHASLTASSSAIVVSMTNSTASLVILNPATLLPLTSPIERLPVASHTCLPVVALSGRLLAFSISDPPSRPGPDGLGSLVTARSLDRNRQSPSRQRHSANVATPQANSAILSSAVGIGGDVARGVWAGLKMGAQAAGRAANQRLASSAPARGSLELDADVSPLESPDDTSESRSLDDSSILDDKPKRESDAGGQWIRIVDLRSQSFATKVIAHFRLPRTKHFAVQSKESRNISTGQSRTIAHLSFSPNGTSLFAAPTDGRTFHLFDIHPAGPIGRDGLDELAGEVWHTYEMRRGNTAAAVSEVQWSADGRWIGVATHRGTVHVFAISPSAGPATAATHVPVRLPNPAQLHPLSTVITPSARVRPRSQPEQLDHDLLAVEMGTTFDFLIYRQNPLRPGISCLDIALYRSTIGQTDLARLSVRAVLSPTEPSRQADLSNKAASGLTEMMKNKVRMVSSDLDVRSALQATWQMPVGPDETAGDLSLPDQIKSGDSKLSNRQTTRHNRAHIEIQTFTHNTHLLPPTIYASHQVDFHDARPIDEYSRISIMDREARTRRLHFRPEVEIHSSTPEAKSIDEPLISALHSVIESSPSSQIPGLPNGNGQSSRQWKTSIPIRQVKEGALHLRREYANRRSSHRRSITTNSLSFEEDTIFPIADEDSNSSPLSSGMPNTDVDVDDQDWNVKWEEEYERAVQDDGGPDDLVLGLMDEQQEERKRWVARQRHLAQQYAKD